MLEQKELTMNDYLEEFLYEKQLEGKSTATLYNYRTVNEIFLNTGLTVNKYIEYLNEKGVKKTTIESYMTAIRIFLRWCMTKGYIDEFKVPVPSAPESEIKVPTEEEVLKLLEQPKNNEPFRTWRTWAIVNLMVSTGLRCRSVQYLKVEDVDFENCELTVRVTKNKKVLHLPISPALAISLRKYINMWSVTNYLFPSDKDGFMSYNALKLGFWYYSKERGVEITSLHSLRHFFATQSVRNGVNPFILQRALGHSDIRVTQRYVNVVNKDVKDEIVLKNPLDMIQKKKRITRR